MVNLTSELKENLIRSARIHRMCLENISALKECNDKSQAIELYKKTIDWALEENYPNISILRKHFSDCGEFGVFVDKEFNDVTLNDQQVYVFHNCTGTISVDLNCKKSIIPMLYFANNCHITIKRCDNPVDCQIRVPVYVFGDNTVIFKEDDDTEFRMYEFDVK